VPANVQRDDRCLNKKTVDSLKNFEQPLRSSYALSETASLPASTVIRSRIQKTVYEGGLKPKLEKVKDTSSKRNTTLSKAQAKA